MTVEGLTFAGIGDARFSPDSGELDIDAAREAAGESAAELAAVVGATNRSGKDVDVALIHDPSRLDPLLGEVPLVLAGHYHSRTVRLDESGTAGDGAGLHRRARASPPGPWTGSRPASRCPAGLAAVLRRQPATRPAAWSPGTR